MKLWDWASLCFAFGIAPKFSALDTNSGHVSLDWARVSSYTLEIPALTFHVSLAEGLG